MSNAAFQERLESGMKGRATFQIMDDQGYIRRIWTRKNAIQAEAKNITARRLIQDVPSTIDTISLYYLGNQVAARSITTTGVVAIAEVSFQTTFIATDFQGSFDTARLTASGLGDFSIISNLVGTKTSSESLLVTWNIQIN